jgi:hypothetical protein
MAKEEDRMKGARFAKLAAIAGILAVVAWGCKKDGSDSGASDSGDSPASDSGGNPPSDSGGEVACTDFGTATPTSSSAEGGDSTEGQYDWWADIALNSEALPEVLTVALYGGYPTPPGITTGSHTLGVGIDNNWSTCAYCVVVFEDMSTATEEPAAVYLATSGTLTLTALGEANAGNLAGTLTSAHFVEVTIDPGTFVSTPVPGGGCYDIDSISFDMPVVPYS